MEGLQFSRKRNRSVSRLSPMYRSARALGVSGVKLFANTNHFPSWEREREGKGEKGDGFKESGTLSTLHSKVFFELRTIFIFLFVVCHAEGFEYSGAQGLYRLQCCPANSFLSLFSSRSIFIADITSSSVPHRSTKSTLFNASFVNCVFRM